jgi:hypothetical protein
MSIRNAAAIVALITVLGPVGISGSTGERAQSPDPDQALQDLRKMIAPSPEAERDYAVALEIWKREQAAPAAPSTEPTAPSRR